MARERQKAKAVVTEPMKDFKSTTGEPVRIALTTGHVAVVDDEEWTPLPKRMWSHAYGLGCESSDMSDSIETTRTDSLDVRKERIMLAIDGMVKAGERDELQKDELFTKSGAPDANVLQQKTGISIKAPERDLLWEEYPEWAARRAAGKANGGDELDIDEDDSDNA